MRHLALPIYCAVVVIQPPLLLVLTCNVREPLGALPIRTICACVLFKPFAEVHSRLLDSHEFKVEPGRQGLPEIGESISDFSVPRQVALYVVPLTWLRRKQMDSPLLSGREQCHSLRYFILNVSRQVLTEGNQFPRLSRTKYGERLGHLIVLPRIGHPRCGHFEHGADSNRLDCKVIGEHLRKRNRLPLLRCAIDPYGQDAYKQSNYRREASSNGGYGGPVKSSRRSFTYVHQDTHLKIPLWTRRHSAMDPAWEVCRA